MSESEQVCLHAIVKGRVQGVGFRAFVVENGVALGAAGWARNRAVRVFRMSLKLIKNGGLPVGNSDPST
jgi:hypothetical protein